MARRKQPVKPQETQRPELLESPEIIEKALLPRMHKGKELLSENISGYDDLNRVEREFEKWDKFNSELIRTFFSTDLIADEYNHSGFRGGFYMGEQSLSERISDHQYTLQGRVDCLESIIERLSIIPLSGSVVIEPIQKIETPQTPDTSKVFIVHGHDVGFKNEVARFIEQIGLQAVILEEQANKGQTIIEKIESNTEVGFSIVLYTACDKGYSVSKPDDVKSRARQNVVLEHGFLMGKLGRSKVCMLVKDAGIETPSDVSGIVYSASGHWKMDVAKELREAGYTFDLNAAL
ncbi:MAG: TIR domain-containing protein [Puniceicoccaceae bacterium]